MKPLCDWQSFPVLGSASEVKTEEPDGWILPDQTLVAIFRDNRRSGLRPRDGRYVLVSNPNPKKRDPLTLSISADGFVFTKMLYLVGGRHIDYPYVIEHEDSLFIAFAGGK